jgi:hypothetical protein
MLLSSDKLMVRRTFIFNRHAKMDWQRFKEKHLINKNSMLKAKKYQNENMDWLYGIHTV